MADDLDDVDIVPAADANASGGALPKFSWLRDPKVIAAVIAAAGTLAAATVSGGMGLFTSGGTAPVTNIHIQTPPPAVDRNGQHDPSTDVAIDVNLMITALNHGNYDAVLRLADQVLRTEAENHLAHNAKGAVAFYRGEFAQAARDFELAHKFSPENRGVTTNLADAYVELRWYDRAIELYDSVRSATPEWWYAQGRAYLLSGRYREAERLLASVPTNFNRGTARILRAAALGALRESAPAAAEFTSGSKQDPEYWRDVLSGERIEPRETYAAVAKLLEEHHVPSL
jgi:tetratricopeptide (TPR) repeat protein